LKKEGEKVKKISLIVLSCVSLFALNIEEAVKVGLENSHRLKSSQLNQNVSQAYLEKTKSGYRPTLDAAYYASSSEQNTPDTSLSPSYASIALGYNLFNGFKDKYSIEGAKENLNSAIFEKDALQADIKLEIQLAFINFLEKRKTLSTKKEAVELVTKSLKDTQAFYDQGLLAKNSLLETKVSLSKTKQDLIIAKSALLIARDSLNRLLGGKLANDEEINEINIEVKDIQNIEELIKVGLENRSEIKSMNASIKEAKFVYDSSKSDLYPKLDLSISHTLNGTDGDLSGRDYMYDDETIASLNLSYNLYKGGANEATRTAYMYKTQILQENLKTLELDIILQIKKTKEAYELSLENSIVTKDAQEYASENFSIMENRYKSQLEKTTDFLKARLDLSEAKIAHIQSLYYIYSQYATILRVTENTK
jgi:outer membrane protein TolC